MSDLTLSSGAMESNVKFDLWRNLAAKIKVKSSFPDAECLGRQESLAPRLIRLHQIRITDQLYKQYAIWRRI